MKILVFVFVLLLMKAVVLSQPPPRVAKEGCSETCGNVTVPYPFGVEEKCYLNEDFLITCNYTYDPPQPFLRKSTREVTNISLDDGEIRIHNRVTARCLNGSTSNALTLQKFSFSSSKNKFVVVGCNSYGILTGLRNAKEYNAGCISRCSNITSVMQDESCLGSGCCQMDIPDGLTATGINPFILNASINAAAFSPCTYAFIAEEGQFKFSSTYLSNAPPRLPIVLDWAIEEDANGMICKDNARRKIGNTSSYLCQCNDGYQGNPYLGCTNINECEDPSKNSCKSPQKCRDTIGNYTCYCPNRGDGPGCVERGLSLGTKISIGISTAVSVVLLSIIAVYYGYQKRSIRKERERFFKENGGMMLQQLLSKVEKSKEKARIFTEDELKKATNNFNESNIVGKGGFGTVYRGTLDKDTVVAIKKSKLVDADQIEQFINEMIVLSQIDHPHAVKLIGCCLETPVPMLVYEFITNRTLHYHLHDEGSVSPMPWETRLRIALETASALAYMHPKHIIHRDVKTANILLDDSFCAKVSDFGASRLVPLDQTQLSTLVQGTLGYIDPEYFHSGLLNDKSDVYSFGVVMVELLTGDKVLSPDRPEKDKSLPMLFCSTMKDNRLFEIVDQRIKKETGQTIPGQLVAFAGIAKRCLRLTREERPTMMEVKTELQELVRIGNSMHSENIPYTRQTMNETEVKTETSSTPPTTSTFSGNSFLIEPDSFRNEVIIELFPSAR